MMLRSWSPQPPERGEQRVVDGADRALEIALEHAVQLQVLPGRDPQRAVAPRAGDAIVREIRLGAHDATGDSRADHHHVVLVEAELARLLAQVAIVLLIHAVELEDHLGVVAEDRRVLEQLLAEGAAKRLLRALTCSAPDICVDVGGAAARIAHDQTVSQAANGWKRRAVPGIGLVS